jgi:hypothetical protein
MPLATPWVSASTSEHPTSLPSELPGSITNSPINRTKSPSKNPKRTTQITIPSTLSLDNFVVPGTQEGLDAGVRIIENLIKQTIETSLSDNQSGVQRCHYL